jgi:integration host factor subunit alpha
VSSLTKAVLSQYLEYYIGLEYSVAMDIVESFFEEIILALQKGEEVNLVGLGKFSVRKKNSRPGRNPKTGEVIPVSARKVVTFQTSATLRKKLNQLSLDTLGA